VSTKPGHAKVPLKVQGLSLSPLGALINWHSDSTIFGVTLPDHLM
jgi:hypothetical protein